MAPAAGLDRGGAADGLVPRASFIRTTCRGSSGPSATLLEGRGGERPEIELRLRARDGGYRWVVFSASYSLADGLVFFCGKDVTARRKGEEELRNAEQRYRAVTGATRDGIVSADISGRIIFWNAGAETIFGRDAADALGRPLDRPDARALPRRPPRGHRALPRHRRRGG